MLTLDQFKELRKQGLSVQQIAAFEKGSTPEPPKAGDNTVSHADLLGTASRAVGPALAGAGKAVGRAAVNALPMIGAGVGGGMGLAGGGPLGAVAGAGLGSAGGEAWRQNINRATGGPAPATGDEAGLRMAGAAAEGAATEGVGRLAMAGAARVARPIMAKALRPAKGLVANFRNVVQDAIAQGARVGSIGGAPGSVGTAAVRRQASQNVAQILDGAARRGVMLDRRELAQPLIDATEARLRRPVTQAEELMLVRRVSQRAGQLLTSASSGIRRTAIQGDPVTYNELRRLARDEARSAVNNAALRLPPSAIPDLDHMIEQGARRALNNNVAGYQPAQEITARAMGVDQAVQAAELNQAPSNVALGAGGFHVGIGVPPEIASRISLMLSDPRIAPLLSNLLKTGAFGVHEAVDPGYQQP